MSTIGFDLETYREPMERAAMRAALGSACGLLDQMVQEIRMQHFKRGRLTKEGQALSDAVQACADKIWEMRDMISVPRLSPREETTP